MAARARAFADLERYRHDDPAFEIDLPAAAEVGTMPGMLVVARAPEDASASPFRTNLTVVAQHLPPDLSAERYAEVALGEAAASFPQWRLIDRQPAVLGGLPAERTLATYWLSRDSGVDFGRQLSVAVEQWWQLRGGMAWIVSASCEVGDYGRVGELWAACAESLRPGP
jgi:hypothetical protein